MAKAAVVRNGVVENVVVIDETSIGWQKPEGTELVLIEETTGPAYMGGSWDGSKFSEPPAEIVAEEPVVATVKPPPTDAERAVIAAINNR